MGVSPEYVDLDSGEVVRLLPTTDSQQDPRRKYVYPGGYVTMGLINVTRIIGMKLPADGYRLALLITTRVAQVSNLCHCTNEEYGRELGVHKNRVSALIGRMCKAGFLYRMNPRLVMVNPSWCFRGTPAQHHQAIETWCKLHPIGTVTVQERKTA